jgi:hypothetical protein
MGSHSGGLNPTGDDGIAGAYYEQQHPKLHQFY